MRPLILLPLVLAACAAAALPYEAVVEEEVEGGGLLDPSPSPLPLGRWWRPPTAGERDNMLVAKWDEALARCGDEASGLLVEVDDYAAYEILSEASDALLERLLGRCYLRQRHAEPCRWYAEPGPCTEAAERLCRWYGDAGPCADAAERLAPTH